MYMQDSFVTVVLCAASAAGDTCAIITQPVSHPVIHPISSNLTLWSFSCIEEVRNEIRSKLLTMEGWKHHWLNWIGERDCITVLERNIGYKNLKRQRRWHARPWTDQNADEHEPARNQCEYHVRKCEDEEWEKVDAGLLPVDSTINAVRKICQHVSLHSQKRQ